MSCKYDMIEQNFRRNGFRPIHAGDDYEHAFTAEQAGSAMDISGAKIWLTVKRNQADADSAALLQYSTAGVNIQITDGVNGQFTVFFGSADTADLAGTWWYDIKVRFVSGKILRLAYGRIEFLPNITQAYV